MTQDELLNETEAALLNAIRQAWRQLQPNWRDIEAQAVVAAASVALLRERPDLDEAGLRDELLRLGVLVAGESGRVQVRVPDCSAPVPSPSSGALQ